MAEKSKDILLNIVKLERRLPVTMASKDPKECEDLFRTLIKNYFECVANITTLELPSTGGSCDVIELIRTLKGLRLLTFKGGSKDKNDKIVRGKAPSLSPLNPQCSDKLVYLDLSFNDMDNQRVPDWVCQLKSLQRLQLGFCRITEFSQEVGNLVNLEELQMKENSISVLPKDFSRLNSLKILNLSGNNLTKVPPVLLELYDLKYVDLSENNITGHLPSLVGLDQLEDLKLHNNKIDGIDESCLEMASLQCLDLRWNRIRHISAEIQSNGCVLLAGNPISCDKTEFDDGNGEQEDMPRYNMEFDRCCINFKPAQGGHYTLPCGAEITLPKNALSQSILINTQVLREEEIKFNLDDLDELLSCVLDLTPNGQTFEEPVKISIPYSFERNDEQIREIIIRVMSHDGKVEDLETKTNEVDYEDKSTRLAEAYTSHFSMFAVVARLMETSAVLEKDKSQLVFTPAFPRTKLQFSAGSVDENTKVTMKVINVDPSVVEEVAKTSTATTSCILCVSVSPTETIFNRPVTVKIALPDKLTGKSFNHEDLKLMKCTCGSPDWIDITADTPLHISSVDVSFQTNSFSKFMLVTEIICGVARAIYRRLRTQKVQFIAMQKRTLPTQVIAQCVLERKVSARIKQLTQMGYVGEDAATPVQDLTEGTSFRIKVVGDLKMQTFSDKLAQRVQEKLIVCRFFSQYPPDKKGFSRFFIESTEERKKCHAGFISFYKLVDEPKEAVNASKPSPPERPVPQKRNAASEDDAIDSDTGVHPQGVDSTTADVENLDDDNNLGDVPIALEDNNGFHVSSRTSSLAELDFGGLGTGMFREDNLRLLAYKIGNEWRDIGTFLGIPYAQMDRITADYPSNTQEQIFQMLRHWAILHKEEEDCIEQFTEALSLAGRNDLVTEVKSLYEDGKRKFQNSVKRKKGIQVPSDWAD